MSSIISRKKMNSQIYRRKSKQTTYYRQATKIYNEVPGLFQVKMSPSLQSVLSCRIGINITNTDRWKYIYKQRLLDELQNRQSINDKEFFKIKAEIKSYQEETILIGSYGDDNFLLCLSEYAKNVCENWKEEEKKQLIEKLSKYLALNAIEWNSLGSEREIDRVLFKRSPFCLEFILYPNLSAKFSLRLVTDVKDGYAEFVNTNKTFNILFRKRLDKASQISKLKKNKQTQTVARFWTHRNIQYCYTYPEVKATKALQLKLNNWLNLLYSDISNLIQYNANINIYTNDYIELPNQKSRYSIENPFLLMSFHECISCHNKVVNCTAWNSHISDIVAAAYARVSPIIFNKEQPKFRDHHLKEIDTNLVLIWSVTQPAKPLLYLHAQREITAINFCPYNPNILVGGCSDGQVVVWDLNGKLDGQKVEVPPQPVEVDVLIKEKMAWMKYPPDEYNVFPCVVSKLDTCHKSRITVIKWLPPEYDFNIWGDIAKCEEDIKHMQFLTTAVGDSIMLAWDLLPRNIHIASTNKKNRLTDRPTTLDEKKSPFSKLNFNFKPIFRLIFVDTDTKAPIYASYFSFKMGPFAYSALNPQTLDNLMERTYFTRNIDDENVVVEKSFLAATEFGQLYQCSWIPFSYDRGLRINEQKIDTISYKSYHDGPIYHIQRNPFFGDIVLTTGGRIFAIWDITDERVKKPLIWRKASNRYLMATWSLQNSASIIASREDGKIELWDFGEDSKSPLRTTKLMGDQLLYLFVNNNVQHVTKGTCLASDFTGTLSIYGSSNLFVNSNKSILEYAIQNIYNQRNVTNYWRDCINKKNEPLVELQEDVTQDEDTKRRTVQLSTEIKQIFCEYKMSPKNIWQQKEHKRMYKILIEKHRINLDSIEKNKKPMNEILESRYARLKKIDWYIINKEKIFQEEKSKLTSTNEDVNKMNRISVNFPKELINVLKEQYYENYKIAETEATKYIQSNRYRYFFDWQSMIHKAYNQYKCELLPRSDGQSSHDFSRKKFMNLIPSNVSKRTTKLLTTEIKLLTSISGK